MKIIRERKQYVFLIFTVVLLGLGTRKFSPFLPLWFSLYAGDVFWACMVFFGFGFLFLQKSSFFVTISAISFCFFIETSQLYHAPWIDAIRKTTLGALILGHGFLWSDLLCYLFGVAMGMMVESYIQSKKL